MHPLSIALAWRHPTAAIVPPEIEVPKHDRFPSDEELLERSTLGPVSICVALGVDGDLVAHKAAGREIATNLGFGPSQRPREVRNDVWSPQQGTSRARVVFQLCGDSRFRRLVIRDCSLPECRPLMANAESLPGVSRVHLLESPKYRRFVGQHLFIGVGGDSKAGYYRLRADCTLTDVEVELPTTDTMGIGISEKVVGVVATKHVHDLLRRHPAFDAAILAADLGWE